MKDSAADRKRDFGPPDREEGMREKLEPYIAEDAYAQILSRYHFEKGNEGQIRALTERLLSVAAPALYYGPLDSGDQRRLAVLVTLGAGVDELQDAYTQGSWVKAIWLSVSPWSFWEMLMNRARSGYTTVTACGLAGLIFWGAVLPSRKWKGCLPS